MKLLVNPVLADISEGKNQRLGGAEWCLVCVCACVCVCSFLCVEICCVCNKRGWTPGGAPFTCTLHRRLDDVEVIHTRVSSQAGGLPTTRHPECSRGCGLNVCVFGDDVELPKAR
jgi:hypothetical protein